MDPVTLFGFLLVFNLGWNVVLDPLIHPPMVTHCVSDGMDGTVCKQVRERDLPKPDVAVAEQR